MMKKKYIINSSYATGNFNKTTYAGYSFKSRDIKDIAIQGYWLNSSTNWANITQREKLYSIRTFSLFTTLAANNSGTGSLREEAESSNKKAELEQFQSNNKDNNKQDKKRSDDNHGGSQGGSGQNNSPEQSLMDYVLEKQSLEMSNPLDDPE